MSKLSVPSPGRGERSSAYLGEGVIEFYGKPSTRTRLHELAHKRMGHEPGVMSAVDYVDRELEAEISSYGLMSKPLTHRIGFGATYDLVEGYGFSPFRAVGLVKRRLKARGVRVGGEAELELYLVAYGEPDKLRKIGG